jgi:hypothetical protein
MHILFSSIRLRILILIRDLLAVEDFNTILQGG